MWTKEEIGKVIKESRLSAGLTQTQVAEALGRPQNTISAWEMGRAQPDANTLFELFQVLGRSVDEAFGFSKQPFEVTRLEQEHIEKYRSLDWYGQETVSAVLECESKRCKAEYQQLEEKCSTDDTIYYVVSFFYHPSSAGTGEIADSEEPESLHLTKKPPRGTSYVVPVSGDSMEPTYHNGDKLFVRAQEEIMPGQIGIFFMDGKQWVKELEDGVLISHNPDPRYAPRPFTEDIRCQGLVLGVCDESYFE